VQDIFFVAVNNGVARVIASLTPDDDVDLAGQYIDDLAFAFIPPLGPDENGICHGVFLLLTKKSRTQCPAEWSKIATYRGKDKEIVG
jgi:hypothetical protein